MSLKTIDLRPAADQAANPEYELAFVARDYVPGHAFVTWTKYDTSTWKPEQIYGFGLYPESAIKIVFGDTPGEIMDEPIEDVLAVSDGLIVRVTKQMYDYALTNTKAIRTGPIDYNLLNESCVDFVRLVATALGLDTPTSSGLNNHPQAFIADLTSRNS